VRAFLVRVGVDQAYGKWNAPVDLSTGQFVYVPIPDGAANICSLGNIRTYEELHNPIANFARTHKVPDLHFPSSLLEFNMHLDPDFEFLTYGDNGTRRGKGIATLVSNDLLVFYAGLRSITPPRILIYALIGIFVVEEVVRAVNIAAERHHENAHTRWTKISENDIVVRGRSCVSGRFDRCIIIGSWRDNSYRVDPSIEDEWGGLNVKNGFIQRSAVPPEFKNASQFHSWLQHQNVSLIQGNY
jgi:hypothetical protein